MALKIWICLFLASAVPACPSQPANGNNENELESTGSPRIDENPVPRDIPDADERIYEIQELLKEAEFADAIDKAESLYAENPDLDGIEVLLVESHLGYMRYINLGLHRRIPLDELNMAMYHHYSRILELDFDNAEAVAGLNSVMLFYESRGMILPGEIDPLYIVAEDNQSDGAEPDENIEGVTGSSDAPG